MSVNNSVANRVILNAWNKLALSLIVFKSLVVLNLLINFIHQAVDKYNERNTGK